MNRPIIAAAGTIALMGLVAAVGTAWAQKASTSSLRPLGARILDNCGNGNGNGNPHCGGPTAIASLLASPSLISFNATSPGLQIPGSSSAVVSFTINPGNTGNTWTLNAGATSATFPGCVTVPVSAVTLRCSSASASGGSAGCNIGSFTPVPPSLPGLTVASGAEPGSSGGNFSVTLAYQLADSWQYIPNICPLTVAYTVNAP